MGMLVGSPQETCFKGGLLVIGACDELLGVLKVGHPLDAGVVDVVAVVVVDCIILGIDLSRLFKVARVLLAS